MNASPLTVVTGASGHVGANLVRAQLRRPRKVRVVVHSDRRALEGLDVEEVRADVLDLESLERVFEDAQTVFHLAAIISITGDNQRSLEDVNVRGVQNVVAACRACRVRRLVHFSSIHAFSSVPKDEVITENRDLVETQGIMPYDWTKAEGERRVLQAVRDGLDAVIVNPTAVVGPHDYKPSEMGRFFLSLFHGRIPAFVDGGFDWVDVRDVVSGAIAAEQRGRRGEQYLFSGQWLSTRDLGLIVEEATGRRVPRWEVPMWLARLGAPVACRWSLLSGKRPLFTSESLHTLQNHRFISSEKARQELGYTTRSLHETIRDTFDWFRESSAFLSRMPAR
jgi:dihydroflavonol-4-reductase